MEKKSPISKIPTPRPMALIAADFPDSRNYVSFLRRAGFSTINLRYDSASAYPAMSALSCLNYDLLVLPGGGDFSEALYHTQDSALSAPAVSAQEAALDMVQYALLASALQRSKGILGICKGMQLINVFFGGTLFEDLPGNIHPRDSSLVAPADAIHKIHTICVEDFCARFGASANLRQETIYRLLLPLDHVNSAHHQGVQRLGQNLAALQYAPDRLPETILHTQLPILGFQWHPERFDGMSPQLMREILFSLL